MEDRKKDRLDGAANAPEADNGEDGMNASRRRALKTIAASGAIGQRAALRFQIARSKKSGSLCQTARLWLFSRSNRHIRRGGGSNIHHPP
jgi:hypothetical protein